MAQAPIVAMLIVQVFGKQLGETVTDQNWPKVAQALGVTAFLMALSALWFGCSNAVREIVAEWAIYHRERMVNLKIPSYVASKFTVLGGLCLMQCTVLLGITHWGCALKAPWWSMVALLFLVSLVGVALGLTLSAVARTSEVAIALLPIILLPMIILGGVLQQLYEMHRAGQFMSHCMASRWAFEGMLVLESEYRPKMSTLAHLESALHASATTEKVASSVIGLAEQDAGARDMAEHYFPKGKHRAGVEASAMVLTCQLLVLIIAIHLILRARDIH